MGHGGNAFERVAAAAMLRDDEPGPRFFLGRGERMQEVIEADRGHLAAMETSAAEVGGRLTSLLDRGRVVARGKSSHGGFVTTESRPFTICRWHYFMADLDFGAVDCPWQVLAEWTSPEEAAPSGFTPSCKKAVDAYFWYRVTYRPTGETVEFFSVLPHMIAAHGFFGGVGSKVTVRHGTNERPVRVEPERLVRVLDISRREEVVVGGYFMAGVRAACRVAEAAGKFPHRITLARGDEVVNARSPLEVLTLALLPGQGVTAVVTKDFPDSKAAAGAIRAAIESEFERSPSDP